MKKVGDLFAELGFRPDASDGVKRAFIENLVRAAGVGARVDERAKEVRSEARSPVSTAATNAGSSAKRPRRKSNFKPLPVESHQLTFDLTSSADSNSDPAEVLEGLGELQNVIEEDQSNAKRRSS